MEHQFATPSGITQVPGRPAQRPVSTPSNAGSARPLGRPADGIDDRAVLSSLLGGLPLSTVEMEALLALAQVRAVAQGQTVLNREADAGLLVALRSGEVALGLRTPDGTFRTERIVRGPAWLDLSSAWICEPPVMDARAQAPSTVIELPCQGLTSRLTHLPGLALRLIQGLAREVQALASNTHELMHKDAPARLAQWLLQRCEPVPAVEGQAVVRLHERKRDVASQLAITPETLSRLMRSFSRQGVIEVAGYTLRVLDTEALARLARS